MDSLTETEIAQIARVQRVDGVPRLSGHFSWPEFSDERQCFHQQFVYDAAVFAAARGFSWPNVIRAAIIAKGIFPQLDGLDAPKLLSLLRDALCECSPNLTPIQRYELTRYLSDTCVARWRLLHAVVGGAANLSITRGHLEVQVPPTPCPLAQGTELREWEHQRQQARLTATVRQKEEELRSLREGSKVTLGAVHAPEGGRLDKEGVLGLVRAAVRASGGQMLESLDQQASLVSDLMQLKLQQAALATRRLHSPVPPNTVTSPLTQTHTSKRKAAHSKN
uniref:uncharacterized protein C8orf74 homolog n=1 Tax=Centroberyx gerrardi TaxID=166262 RepID=UPI003AADD629